MMGERMEGQVAIVTADHIPRARFIGYPSGGHMLVGHSAEANSRIAAFLKESARY